MRHECSGGIYGKPFTIQLITATGKSVTVDDSRAHAIHTRIMSTPKGPEREEVTRKAYEEVTGENVNETE